MQFQIPQFLEIEDKVIGPLTIKQFLYLLFGGAIVFILWNYLRFWLFIIIALPITALSISLAFVKINGQPFEKLLLAVINYFLKPRLYIWKKK